MTPRRLFIGLSLGLFALWTTPTALATTTHKACQTPPKNMLCIPGGNYIRGSQRNAQHKHWKFRAESPRHSVTLSTFYIDKYEITNAQYIKCMKAGHCKPPSYWARLGGSFWKRFRTPKRPFVRATWFLAYEYCRWAGKRLLTEAEWEAAARGPKGDTYPWGNSPPDCSKANYRTFPPNTSYPPSRKMRFCYTPIQNNKEPLKYGQDQTWPVGITPPFRGIFDMAGNGYEWVQDFYNPHAYADCDNPKSTTCPRVNPSGPCQGKPLLKCILKAKQRWTWKRTPIRINGRKTNKFKYTRVLKTFRRPRTIVYKRRILKGGSWWWYADRMRAAHRRPDGPYTGSHRLSIRCGSSSHTLSPLPPKPPKNRRKTRRRTRRKHKK